MLDVRSVLQQGHRDVTVADLPAVLLPRKGPFGLVDYEKVFCPDPATDVFELRGLDRQEGALVLVRPDQYVANVLPLDAEAYTDRNTAERCINKLKQHRAVATRYDKRDYLYQGTLTVASIRTWLHDLTTRSPDTA